MSSKNKKEGTLTQNFDKNKAKIYIKIGSLLVGMMNIVGAFLPKFFGNGDPLVYMLFAGIVAVCIPILSEITGLIFGAETEQKLEIRDKEHKAEMAPLLAEIDKLRDENLELRVTSTTTLERLDLEQHITEWKLQSCATNDQYREALAGNRLWEKIEQEKQNILEIRKLRVKISNLEKKNANLIKASIPPEKPIVITDDVLAIPPGKKPLLVITPNAEKPIPEEPE